MQEYIHIKGARTNNLKNINVDIPVGKLVVITGLSGSGKSSLAFDTLYAEGQRRYVESLSAYARQFLSRMQKPDVDFIEGIPPAIAIQQRTISKNPRSTVGTQTEIFDYLKLFFARIGHTLSPVSGERIMRHEPTDVVRYMQSLPVGSRLQLLSPIVLNNRALNDLLTVWQSQGFSRLIRLSDNGETEVYRIADMLEGKNVVEDLSNLYLLVDRILSDKENSTANRFADSVQTAFFEGLGECIVLTDNEKKVFSQRFEADGIVFQEPTEHLFDFNNPLGACPTCNGFGNIIGIDPNLVVPNPNLSIYEEAIACWHGEKMRLWNDELIRTAPLFNFPIHTPFYKLTAEQKQLIWKGNEYFHGLNDFFQMLEKEQYAKIQYRVMLARYRGKTLCPDCNGSRLRREASYVYIEPENKEIGKRNIEDLITIPITELAEWFDKLILPPFEQQAARQLLQEIRSRLQFMLDVGLGYLTLNRAAATLSGGESQRINLAKSLGSSLVGSLYILDEPSIGLHPRDTGRLINVLKQLRDLGNTVVVVEHDDEMMRAADCIIDVGPEAGRDGGKIVWQWNKEQGTKTAMLHSYTQDFLSGKEGIDVPLYRRPWRNYVEIQGVTENNLQGLNVRFPLGVMTVVTGVSGSGKSSLVSKALYSALKGVAGNYSALVGSTHFVGGVEFVDQNPIGTSTRSNAVTYIKAYDDIRKLYADQQLAKQMDFSASFFSFNTPGGRCEQCKGEGTITIEMQFMADIVMQCEQCGGKRFKKDVLEVLYRGKSIYDILQMTVSEAVQFFSEDKQTLCKSIVRKLKALEDVGVGYIQLGQPSSTLSGGENQRVKLATFLLKENADKTGRVFIFDEPTTGLHFHDIKILLKALHSLIELGNTVIVIEHNPAVIMAADHIIDLGPEGGKEGGTIVFEGTPERLMSCEKSFTGKCLATNKSIQYATQHNTDR